jgi:mRNA-degrading endonuclease RelE of RelBE toxin-antitoxin system
MTLQESIQQFVSERYNYYDQWSLDTPIVITKQCDTELQSLQKVIYKIAHEFVINYQLYKHLMPVKAEVENIINLCNTKEYKIGTYRTDFVFDESDQMKFIEITCRFALNGMFQTAIFQERAVRYQQKNCPSKVLLNHYDSIVVHFEKYMKNKKRILVLCGSDVKNESNLYIKIFERTGIEVLKIQHTEIEKYTNKFEDAWILSELSFDEILGLPQHVITKLIDANVTNDFRTIFLIHDKRFFDVLCNKKLQQKVLSESESVLLNKYSINTYSYAVESFEWQNAKQNKNSWIIKHRALGKSQDIFAGVVMEQEDWDNIFKREDIHELILQEWVPQKKYPNSIKGKVLNDFAVGTLLFFDDNFFGLGEFRTSSHPITNKGDHRKSAGMVFKNEIPEILINQTMAYEK